MGLGIRSCLGECSIEVYPYDTRGSVFVPFACFGVLMAENALIVLEPPVIVLEVPMLVLELHMTGAGLSNRSSNHESNSERQSEKRMLQISRTPFRTRADPNQP